MTKKEVLKKFKNKAEKGKSLQDTNPHLRSKTNRERLIGQSVLTSGGVEGIRVNPIPSLLKPHNEKTNQLIDKIIDGGLIAILILSGLMLLSPTLLPLIQGSAS